MGEMFDISSKPWLPMNYYISEDVAAFGKDVEIHKWKSIFDALDRLLLLKPDWDGEESDPPSFSLIESVQHLLVMLHDEDPGNPPSHLVPIADGRVLIDWQSKGNYIEIEVMEPYMGEVMTVIGKEKPIHDIWRWKPEKNSYREKRGEDITAQTWNRAVAA